MLDKDSRESIELLNSRTVEYLIVGAHALAYHGCPRYTGDLDVWINRSRDNAAKFVRVLREFGFASVGLSETDFEQPNQVIQLGYPPFCIDLLTGVTGVAFEEAWLRRLRGEFQGVTANIMDRESLIKNKSATGRPQDIADVEKLSRQA